MFKQTKKHFVFDLDDTLADSYSFNQQIFIDAFAPYLNTNNAKTNEFLKTLHLNERGSSMYSQFNTVIKHFSLKIEPSELVKYNEGLQLKNIHKMRMFDAVEDVIKILNKNGKEISICSNRDRKSLARVLKNNNIEKYFTNIISCSELGHEKPDPFSLHQIIKNNKYLKRDYIYFGDSNVDREFATNAGVDFMIIDHYLNQKVFYKMMLQSFM